MRSFLKSIFDKNEPDILESLSALREIEGVRDYCVFDTNANVTGTGLCTANARESFSSVGKEAIRMCLLISAFAKYGGADSKLCQVHYGGGTMMIWSFGSIFLMVLLNDAKCIPIVRMTVNIFRQTASESRYFGKYFKESDPMIEECWKNDSELMNMIDIVIGKQTREKQ